MMKILSRNFNYILIGLIVAFFAFKLLVRLQAGSDGDLAPNFKTQLVDGSEFELSELRGNYVVLSFWASWCGPCYREHPKLLALNKKYGDDNFEIVSIALEKKQDGWKPVAKKYGFTWKYQIAEVNQFVLLSSLAQQFGVTDLPTKFLIDPDGKMTRVASLDEVDKLLSKNIAHLTQ